MDYSKLKKLNKKELIAIIIELDKNFENKSLEEKHINNENIYSVDNNFKKIYKFIKKLVFSIITVGAITVLISNLVAPVMKVSGTSMEPVLRNGDILIAIKNEDIIKKGDIIAFYYNNKVLLKRAIGFSGDKINIDENGNVFVNNEEIKEPYVSGKSLGECDVNLPLVVSPNSIFVLGDRRSVSVDSRSSEIGNVKNERIVGKIVFRIWPLDDCGTIGNIL